MEDQVIDLDVSGDEEVPLGSARSRLQAVEAELEQVEEQIEVLLARQQELQALKTRLQSQAELNARAPRADWAGKFAWDAQVLQLLGDVFQLRSFREQQREVINATLQGRDVLCLMPSGGGKSLCYQLPSMMANSGCTVVISPLLSLITDQVFHLEQLKIRAVALTSLSSKEALAEAYKAMDSDLDLRFVFATPERLVNAKRFLSKLEKMYKANRLSRIAIDEAHCCSQWGNDFRPDYKKLGILKQLFPNVPILALTATATHRVQSDLKSILCIPDCEIFRSSVNRPNLHYEVNWKAGSLQEVVRDMCSWIQAHFGPHQTPSGIVYCLTKKDTALVAEQLSGEGMVCAIYHADVDPQERGRIHELWRTGEVPIIVATIAFGMGINKPDVRFVIHHTLSKSVENYYQESGRAGRDGLPAKCLLYYRPADALRQAAMVVSEPGWFSHLSGMLAYAHNTSTCRRNIITRHFGETAVNCGGACQVCANYQGPERQEISQHAKEILQTLASVPGDDKRLTLTQLIDRWRALKVEGGASLGKGATRDMNEQVIGCLLQSGILVIDFGFTAFATNPYLKASARGLRGFGDLYLETLPMPEGAAVNPAHPAKKKAKLTSKKIVKQTEP